MNKISIKNFSGFFDIESKFYRIKCSCEIDSEVFSEGINVINGDIDAYGIGISYAISMIKYAKYSILSPESEILLDGVSSNFRDICDISCYVDEKYPLFNNKKTVKKNIEIALKKSKLNVSSDYIKRLFELSEERYNRPIIQVGNERLRCLAAIGFAYNKTIFCFPWMSKSIMSYYGENVFKLLDILSSQHKFVILPTNYF